MRGKEQYKMTDAQTGRITPAYAGKSFFFRTSLVQWQDHPRLCGEKNPKNPAKNSRKGSPPPMRGKVEGAKCVKIDHGITPAYAGKSGGTGGGRGLKWDHPRLCGEKTKKIPKQRYFFHQPASFSFSLQYT